MPEIVIISGHRRFRAHMRAVHGLRNLSDDQCNEYRSDGGTHYNRFNPRRQTGINLSADDFGNLLNKVQSTISLGIERGINTAMQASATVAGPINQPVASYPTVSASGSWANGQSSLPSGDV